VIAVIRAAVALVATLLPLAGIAAPGDVTRLTIEDPYPQGWPYGAEISVLVPTQYEASCDTLYVAGGTVTASVDGRLVSNGQSYNFGPTCIDGVLTVRNYVSVIREMAFGPHLLTVDFHQAGTSISLSATLAFTVKPDASTGWPTGTGILAAATTRYAFGGSACAFRSMEFAASTSAPLPPPRILQLPYGFLNYRFDSCTIGCIFDLCAREGEREPMPVVFEFPDEIPANATLWGFGFEDRREWQPLAAELSGRRAKVRLLGTGVHYTRPEPPYVVFSNLRGSVALAVPKAITASHDLQGLWWAGPSENGWGVSLMQAGERLFVVLFIYDQDGRPTWLVAPQGSWIGGTFRAELQRASTRPGLGELAGSITLSFSSATAGDLSYTLGGSSARKTITRMPMGAANPSSSGSYSGAWWSGSSGGGGALQIHQQGETLFVLWQAFDRNGRATWYVVPGGAVSPAGEFTGTLYATAGSPWIGAEYDASRLAFAAVGPLTLRFTPDEARMDYSLDGIRGSAVFTRQPF
jgi:hypothetical protein